jgi:hypothetical protein
MRLLTHDENSVIPQHLQHSFSKRKPPYEIILLQFLNHHKGQSVKFGELTCLTSAERERAVPLTDMGWSLELVEIFRCFPES